LKILVKTSGSWSAQFFSTNVTRTTQPGQTQCFLLQNILIMQLSWQTICAKSYGNKLDVQAAHMLFHRYVTKGVLRVVPPGVYEHCRPPSVMARCLADSLKRTQEQMQNTGRFGVGTEFIYRCMVSKARGRIRENVEL